MSEPVSPEVAQQEVVSQLQQQAASLSPPAAQIPVGGQPQAIDANALLERLQELERQVAAANQAAAEAKAAAEPKPPALSDVAVNVADAAARHAFQIIAEHLGL